MGLFFYTQKGSIISTVVLPTTEIIEPKSVSYELLAIAIPKERLEPKIEAQVDAKQVAAAESPATKPSQATSRLPETGDNMNLATTVSGLALLGLAISKRKQESE